MAALLCGLSLGVASCSSDDDDAPATPTEEPINDKPGDAAPDNKWFMYPLQTHFPDEKPFMYPLQTHFPTGNAPYTPTNSFSRREIDLTPPTNPFSRRRHVSAGVT